MFFDKSLKKNINRLIKNSKVPSKPKQNLKKRKNSIIQNYSLTSQKKIQSVHIYLAEKRKIQKGENVKGLVS